MPGLIGLWAGLWGLSLLLMDVGGLSLLRAPLFLRQVIVDYVRKPGRQEPVPASSGPPGRQEPVPAHSGPPRFPL